MIRKYVSSTPLFVRDAKQFSNFFKRKMALLIFTERSLYSQTIHASTPPAYSSLPAGWACLLAAAVAAASSSLCASGPRCCTPARRDSHVHLFLAVDLKNLVHLLENYPLPWWYSGFTQSHGVKQRWRASVYGSGRKVLSIFCLIGTKKYWICSSFLAVKAGKAKISSSALKYIIWRHRTEAIIRAREEWGKRNRIHCV